MQRGSVAAVILIGAFVVVVSVISYFVLSKTNTQQEVGPSTLQKLNFSSRPSSLEPSLSISQGEPESFSSQSARTSLSPVSPSPAMDLPPVYSGIQWLPAEERQIVFRTYTNDLIELTGRHTESVLVRFYPDDFLTYYRHELALRGWNETEDAGGPNGEWHGYEKDPYYIRFGVRRVTEFEYQAVVENN